MGEFEIYRPRPGTCQSFTLMATRHYLMSKSQPSGGKKRREHSSPRSGHSAPACLVFVCYWQHNCFPNPNLQFRNSIQLLNFPVFISAEKHNLHPSMFKCCIGFLAESGDVLAVQEGPWAQLCCQFYRQNFCSCPQDIPLSFNAAVDTFHLASLSFPYLDMTTSFAGTLLTLEKFQTCCLTLLSVYGLNIYQFT